MFLRLNTDENLYCEQFKLDKWGLKCFLHKIEIT